MGKDERKISVKNKDMYIKKNCGDSAVLFLCDTHGGRPPCLYGRASDGAKSVHGAKSVQKGRATFLRLKGGKSL